MRSLRYIPGITLAVAGILLWSFTARAQVTTPSTDEMKRLDSSMDVLHALVGAEDNGIPRHLLTRAEAIVVIPSLIKGGFVIGAKHGKGVISVRDRASDTWSDPAFINMTGGNIGWQIGVESIDLVLLVMNRDGVEKLLEDRFTLGGNLSVAGGPVGRSGDAATNAQFAAQILAYSRARGLFAGATLEGAALHADSDSNRAFYGRSDPRDIVMAEPSPTAPAAALAWRNGLKRVVNSPAPSADLR